MHSYLITTFLKAPNSCKVQQSAPSPSNLSQKAEPYLSQVQLAEPESKSGLLMVVHPRKELILCTVVFVK